MFLEKLNKKQEGVYVIEEEKIIINGIWEGILNHDNVNHQSISIYTESKLTGSKVDNYLISTPSETPWKTYLKVFSNSEKVYVVYETTGDQVEADDINLLQDALVDEIKRAITREDFIDVKLDDEIARATNREDDISNNLNAEITRSIDKDNNLEEKKADLTYVDTGLLKKYDKDRVYTKEETVQLIDDLIDGSPDALDTLKEIANALNNDPNFAATMTNELSKKVDKVTGKSLSDENYTLVEKSKLAGVENKANNYIHPSTHPPTIIAETASKRFVSDAEKANWNSKWDYSENTIKGVKVNNATNSDTVNGKTVEIDVPANAKFTDTNTTYSEITTAEIDTGTASTLRTITARRLKYVMDKVQSWINALTKADIGLGNVDDIKQATKAEFNTHNNDNVKHITPAERTNWNNKADKVDGKGFSDENYTLIEKNKLAGIATSANNYIHPSTHPPTIIAETASKRFVSDAEKANWNAKETTAGAQAKATSALDSAKTYAENLNSIANEDTRAVNSPPSFYGGRRVTYEFKQSNVLGLSGLTYVMLETINPWSGYGSSHIPSQIAHMGKIIYTRQATSASSWGPWSKNFTQGTPLTCNDLKGV